MPNIKSLLLLTCPLEAVLKWIENVVFLTVFHDVTDNNEF